MTNKFLMAAALDICAAIFAGLGAFGLYFNCVESFSFVSFSFWFVVSLIGLIGGAVFCVEFADAF